MQITKSLCWRVHGKKAACLALGLATSSIPISAIADTTSADSNAPIAPMVSRPGYATAPYDKTASKVPVPYQGIDPVATFVNMTRTIESTKGEFETTQQFNDRIAGYAAKPLVGQLTLSSTYAFVADKDVFTTSYDADKQQLNITLKVTLATAPFVSDHHTAFELFSSETNKQIVSETNGFGAEVDVAKADENTVSLSLVNIKDYHFKWNDGDESYVTDSDTDVAIPMSVDVAKSAKLNIGVLVVGELAKSGGHYAAASAYETTPTASSPFDLSNNNTYIAINADEIDIYDTASGTIYDRLVPTLGK